MFRFVLHFFFSLIRRPPVSPRTDHLCPYTTLFRAEIGLVSRAESGEWLLARDFDDLSLAELYESCNLRIPINEAHLPCHDDALGQDAIRTLDRSEEHTSELQSLMRTSYAVFRLKKQQNNKK